MTVEKLIEALQEMPKDAQVWQLWDGELRTQVEIVYLSKSGKVVTSDFEMVCYAGNSRPVDAPGEKEDRYWETEKNSNGYQYDESAY